MNRSLWGLCTALATVVWTPAVFADAVVSFAFGRPSYWVKPGGKVDIPVYWQQTVGEGETSVLDPSSGVGMFGQGVQIRWDNPVMPSQPAAVLHTEDIAYNPDFVGGVTQKAATDSYAQLSETMDMLSLAVSYGSQTSEDEWRQRIGVFSFTAGPTPGEVTHLSAVRYVGPMGTEDYVIDAIGNAYDGATNPATATITVVPEPSSLTPGVVASLALASFDWFKRMKRRHYWPDPCAGQPSRRRQHS